MADAPLFPAALPANERVRRQWQQPLGDIHNKLGNIVGAGSLSISFDCSDQDFVFALTSRWPLGTDFNHSLYEADTLKLADALNGLARLYAIETGQDRLHVLLEARRGKPELPGWWRGPAGSAPVLFATYAFDTNFAEVGLFGDLEDAYADMELLTHPHRLLLAIGPATPIMVDADGSEVLLDADEERLVALKRWNQRLALQINQLLAATFDGGEEEMEAVVEALSKVRDLSGRLAVQLLERESRLRRRNAKPDDGLNDDLYDSMRGRKRGLLPMPELKSESEQRLELRLGETLAGLQDALKSESLNSALNPTARADLQKSLATLVPPPKKVEPKKMEIKPEVKAPERRPTANLPKPKAKVGPGPTAAMVALLLCVGFGAQARGDDKFGLGPYRDTMKFYEYTPTADARLSSGGNGTVTPPAPTTKPKAAVTKKKTVARKSAKKDDSYKPSAPQSQSTQSPAGKWEENKNNCAGRAAHTARRRFGNVPIETYSDANEGAAIVDGKRYTYSCSGDPETGLLVFRPDKAD